MTGSTPLLSVVVIGRNEGDRLVRCLESVAAMRRPAGEVEVLYVDSDSTDSSRERAVACGASVIHLRSARPSAALGRNAGWRAARGRLILFLDGDTTLHPEFVERAVGELDDPRVAVVWGHRRELRPRASWFNRVLDLDWVYAPGDSEFCGGDALVRRAALEEVGGFDENLIAGEEPEMCARLRRRGRVIRHVDAPMTGHDLAMTRWSQYWRRAFRAGYAYAEVVARFRGTATALWEREVRRNLVHGSAVFLLPAVALLAAIALGSWWPVALCALLAVLVVGRTARRAAWKSSDALTLVSYGVHSHLQQAPILLGQLAYRRDRMQRRVRGLIDYKEA